MRELEMVLQCVLGCNIVSLLIPIRAGWLVYFGQEVPGSSLLHYIWSWSVYDRQTSKQSSVFVTVMELAVALHSICAWQMDKQELSICNCHVTCVACASGTKFPCVMSKHWIFPLWKFKRFSSCLSPMSFYLCLSGGNHSHRQVCMLEVEKKSLCPVFCV